MPQFQLPGAADPEFTDLDSFTQGYITAMFWTESASTLYYIENWFDPETQEAVAEGQSDGVLPSDAGFTDLHPTALADIIADCARFQSDAAALLSVAYDSDEYSAEQAGHDYWLTRNGHGTGFWDREALEGLEVRDALSDLARAAGEPQVWFADHVEYGNAPFVYHS